MILEQVLYVAIIGVLLPYFWGLIVDAYLEFASASLWTIVFGGACLIVCMMYTSQLCYVQSD